MNIGGVVCNFFNDLTDITHIDWNIMNEKYWNDTIDDPDRKRRRQAEFLVHQFIGLEHFLGIIVKNSNMKEKIEKILDENSIKLPVLKKQNFYF